MFKSTLHCVINTLCLVHVLVTLVAILREVHYKGYITHIFEPVCKCKILSFKTYGLKYRLKIQIKTSVIEV